MARTPHTAPRRETLYDQIPRLFFETRQIMRARLPSQVKKDPNNWLHCEMVRFVEQYGDPTMRDIAAHLRITAPSATSLVNLLVKKGLLTHKRDSSDRRTVRVELTTRGARHVDRYRTQARSAVREVFASLDDASLKTLVRALERVVDEQKSVHTKSKRKRDSA